AGSVCLHVARHRVEAIEFLELLCAVADKSHAGCVLRTLNQLYDALHADGEPEPNGHTEDFFGRLAHAFHQYGSSGPHAPRAHLVDEIGVLHTSAHFTKNLFYTRFDNIAHHAARDPARSMTAHARHLDVVTIVDHATKRAAKVALQALGLCDGRAQSRSDVTGNVVSARWDNACVRDGAVDELDEVCRASAKVDHGDAD